ncbi:DUF4439 domain-containing protein [Kineococcus sp. LSe6-4]|uniref:DUF4439 domain-containing protein n=1 Tax=Kineococcus halophytocola TaxID=3234027 RepID=A0ABV4H058_9ACTN
MPPPEPPPEPAAARPLTATPPRRPARRTLLTAMTLAVPVLAGCGVRWVVGDEPTPTPERGPDDVAREAAVGDTVALLAVLDPAAGGPAPLQAVAAEAAQVCRAHLLALGGAGDAPGPANPADAPADAQVVTDRLAQASTAAVTQLAPAEGRAPGAGTARLLAAVAASRALLADAVAAATGSLVRSDQTVATGEDAGPDVPAPPADATPPAPTPPGPTGSPTAAADPARVRALQAALAGEHAAVHAYALVAGRLAPPRREEALADLAGHRTARDDLVDELVALGAAPVEAAAGYDVQAPTAPAATALAATVEERVTTLRVEVVATAGPARADAAGEVVAAARAARRWGSTVLTFPGMPWLGEDGRALPGPGPSTTP